MPLGYNTPPEVQRKMCDLYLQGCTLTEAASAFGLTTKAARNALMRAGIERREGGTPVGTPMRDLSTKKFGRLKVIGPNKGNATRKKGSAFKWDCVCKCGNKATVDGGHLGDGHTRSCGCLQVEETGIRHRTHGKTGTPEYVAWARIKQRCFDQKCTDWPAYGGRGIVMCRGLRASFPEFFKTLGARPTKRHSVDRKDNDKGYTCGRCAECLGQGWKLNIRWATPADQAKNTRISITITFQGETLSLKEWSKKRGIPYDVLHQRLANGWDAERALTTPARKRGVSKTPQSRRYQLRETWRGIIRRCHNPKCREFKWYGAKGVSMCQKWRDSFDTFATDVGERPTPQHTLDRIDPTGNYEPGNVRWTTWDVQCANKRKDRAAIERKIPRKTVVL